MARNLGINTRFRYNVNALWKIVSRNKVFGNGLGMDVLPEEQTFHLLKKWNVHEKG